MNTPIPATATNPFGFPAGPAVPYARVLHATEDTFRRLLTTLAARYCTLEINPTAQTAGVHWFEAAPGGDLQISLAMPALPPHALLSRGEATRMVALLVHELMHVLHTDRHAWKPGTTGNPRLDALVNGLEDARIEALEIGLGRMPGARDLFEALSEHYIQEALREGWTPGGPRTVSYTLATLGRVHLGHVLPSAARITVPAAMQPIVDIALDRLPGCQNTGDIVRLAQDLLPLVDALEEPPPPPPPVQDAQDASQDAQEAAQAAGSSQDAQDTSQGAPGAQDGSEAPDEAAPAQDPAGTSPGADTGADPGTTVPPTGGYPDDAGAGDPAPAPAPASSYAPDEAMQRMVEDIAKRAGAEVDSRAGRKLSGWRGPLVESSAPVRQTGDMSVTRTRAFVTNAARLKDTVRRHLRAPEAVALERRLTAGRLDRRAVTRMSTGARNVMTRRIDADAVNVGVVLLLDRSNSMNEGHRSRAARSLALHLGEACQHAGAECLIAAFSDMSLAALQVRGKSGLLIALKTWTQKMTETVTRNITGLTNSGGTPLAQGIMGATDLLRARSHLSRRIVIALTDGEDDAGNTGVEWATGYATTHGVEVIGLLLEGPDTSGQDRATVQQFERGFTKPVQAHDARQLTVLALAALARALQGKR